MISLCPSCEEATAPPTSRPRCHAPGPCRRCPRAGRPAEVRAAEILAGPLNRIAAALEQLAAPEPPDGYLVDGKVRHPSDVTIIRASR